LGKTWCGGFGRVVCGAVLSVVDFIAEDRCRLCGGDSPGVATSDPVASGPARHLIGPVCTPFIASFDVPNHPICVRCAATLVRARQPGVLGRVHDGQVVTSSGERFGTLRPQRRPPIPGAPSGTGPEPSGTPRIPVFAPFMIDDSVLKIIHLMKFSGYEALIPPLARAMAAAVGRWAHRPASRVVTGVPGARRGWLAPPGRHAEALASELAMCLGAQATGSGALRCIRRTARQSTLAHERRGANVRGAFSADPAVFRGCHVILVDDLVTTGATAGSASSAILASGASGVEVASFGRAM
jgi:predicted amidophosphoribosyltransferase